jgi:predicted ester cyclase
LRLLSILAPMLASTVASALALATPAAAAQVSDAAALDMTRPKELIAAGAPERQAELLKPVAAFYGFWANGSPALLAEALSPKFVDHTLPPGRPQGPTGPAAASKVFLGAVPDLRLTVVQQLLVGDRVVSHLRFTGHFTGVFKGVQGQGQPVDFIATDILKVQGGRVTDNWHLEDNLAFEQQIGAVAR